MGFELKHKIYRNVGHFTMFNRAGFAVSSIKSFSVSHFTKGATHTHTLPYRKSKLENPIECAMAIMSRINRSQESHAKTAYANVSCSNSVSSIYDSNAPKAHEHKFIWFGCISPEDIL